MKFLLTALALTVLPLFADEAFDQARSAYDQGHFAEALQSYQSIDGQSAALDYNIGNTLMRLDQQTEAIAYYRRALWQNSGDPDIRANLKRAIKQTGAVIPPLPRTRRLLGFLEAGQWQMTFILSCWLFAGLGMLRYKSELLRMATGWVFPLLIVWILFCGWGVWVSRPQAYFDEAVIKSSEVTARFEPLSDATEHFSLLGGSVVKVLDQSRTWYRISAGEKQGWVPEDQLFLLKTLGDKPHS